MSLPDEFRDQCARCGRVAPPAAPGPEGQAAQGWATFESDSRLIIDVPYPEEGRLMPEVVAAIGAFDGTVAINADPQVNVPALREVASKYVGVACADCQRETGWDNFDWFMFMAGLTQRADS